MMMNVFVTLLLLLQATAARPGVVTGQLQTKDGKPAAAIRISAVPAPAPLFSSLLNYRHTRRVDAVARAARRQAWEGVRRIRGSARTWIGARSFSITGEMKFAVS